MNKLDLEILELFKQLTKDEKCDALSFAVDLIHQNTEERYCEVNKKNYRPAPTDRK